MSHILIVEDSQDDLELMRLALRRAKVTTELRAARDGVEALEFLRTGELPHVVLLDLRMPRLDGFQVLDRIRRDARTATLPVVILSSSDEQGDIQRAYALGANSFVCKPLGFQAAQRVVGQLGRYWTELNRRP